MSKFTVEQISHAIDQLPKGDKIKIAERLQDFVVQVRVHKILRSIDARKGLRPSTHDILKEIHTYRQHKHAQSRH